jgi:twinkle protein
MDECPFCLEKFSMRFSQGYSTFECTSCHKMGDYNEFITALSHMIEYRHLVESLSKPRSPEGLIDVATYVQPKTSEIIIPSGFRVLDKLFGGFKGGELTILSGKRSEGKSTFAGQLALGAINDKHRVFYYSGELAAKSFQSWIFLQAAGTNHLHTYLDRFEEVRYAIDEPVERPIREWLGGKLILYDNRIIKTSESNTILERAMIARDYYGCELFIIDNLKTARFKKDSERDHFRKQANFAADMLAFSGEYNSSVILVAHPKKDDTGDLNDNVAGLSDITDIAHNVMTVQRMKPSQQEENGCDAILEVSKNREYGTSQKLKMDFDVPSKRFYFHNSANIDTYNWEFQEY